MSLALETKRLTKHYGRIKAVQTLDLEVEKGQVFGLLGPNGSGKTTTLGMLLGVTQKTSGTFSWFGEGDHYELRKRVGAILEHPIFYPFLNAVENLRITARIKDIADPDLDHLLRLVGLYDRRNDNFGTYSLGMKQRLAIASALVADPEFLIFDEPTNGLDPQGIADIRALVRRIADMGKTILLASHLLDEVQKVCSHFAVLRMGEKIYQGSVEDALNQKTRIELGAPDMESLRRAASDSSLLSNIEERNGLLVAGISPGVRAEDVNRHMTDRGIFLSHLAVVRSTLEERFLSILKENDQ